MMATALNHSTVDTQFATRPLRCLATANLTRQQKLPVLIGALGFFAALLAQFSRNPPSAIVAGDFNIGLGLGFASLFLLVGLEIFQARFQCRERTRLQSLLQNSAPLVDVRANGQAAWSWVPKVMPLICLPMLLLVPFQPQPRLPALMLTALGLCLFVKFVFQAMSIQRERIALFDRGVLLDQSLGTAFYPWECFQEIIWREPLESLVCKIRFQPDQIAQLQTIDVSFLSPAEREQMVDLISQHAAVTQK